MLGFTKQNLLYNFLIWSIVALFTTTQLYLKAIQSGVDSNWWFLLQVQLWVWWIWGGITPLVFWLGNHFRVDRTKIWKILLLHLPLAVMIVCVYLTIYAFIWNLNSQVNITYEHVLGTFTLLFLNLFHWHFFIYMAIIGIVHARSYYQEGKDRALRSVELEKQLLQSQLDFLKMQLQPHFLFNTLNSIVSSMHQGKTKVAISMTTELSELLRMSLAGSDRQIVSLKEELNHVKTYLGIEKHRYKKLQIHYQIPDELLPVEVPNFILQPIVENAIKHGIAKQSVANRIFISAKEQSDSILFLVENEGPKIKDLQEGVGISNIKSRLQALFGKEGKFNIQASEKGTIVHIEIPKA